MQAFNMRIDTIFSTFQLPAQKNILSAMHLQASQRFLVLLNLRYEKKSPLPEHQRAIIDFSSHAFSRFQMTQNLLDAETAQQIKYFSKRPFLGKYDIIFSNIKRKENKHAARQRKHKKIRWLIAFAILLYLGVQNLHIVISTVRVLLGFLPFIIGFGIAFILNIPMKFIEHHLFGKALKQEKKQHKNWQGRSAWCFLSAL